MPAGSGCATWARTASARWIATWKGSRTFGPSRASSWSGPRSTTCRSSTATIPTAASYRSWSWSSQERRGCGVSRLTEPAAATSSSEPAEGSRYCLCESYARVTERAALAGARWLGRADQEGAQEAALSGMQLALEQMPISGHIVIGGEEEGELRPGSKIGAGGDPVDLSVDPLEGRGGHRVDLGGDPRDERPSGHWNRRDTPGRSLGGGTDVSRRRA